MDSFRELLCMSNEVLEWKNKKEMLCATQYFMLLVNRSFSPHHLSSQFELRPK